MKTYALSREQMESISPPNVPHVIFSIKTPGDSDANVPSNGSTIAIARFAFDDIDISSSNYSFENVFGRKPIYFNDFMANKVANTLKSAFEKHDDIPAIICHCDAGMSRSAGMAAAISKYFADDDSYFFSAKTPNMRVFRKVYAALSRAFN